MTGTTIRQTAAPSLLTANDLWLFNEGSHARLWESLGSHLGSADGRHGCFFSVWAPDARRVAVLGDWNGWNKSAHLLQPCGDSGVWETFVPEVTQGQTYKFHITARNDGSEVEKADPFAVRAEVPPKTASVVHDLAYDWGDCAWMRERGQRNALSAPMSIYELHLASWRTVPGEGDRSLTYRELAQILPEHVKALGFTHVELMPVMEHPYSGSWGYQLTGYFAATSRFGTPQDLMALIDALHRAEIGVILDWVPSHFPLDQHGLARFDGSHLYEHQDHKEGFHPDWTSGIFNYGRNEVRAFLISSACFWLEVFHADGLRVDAVASMLYRDYSRKEGEWIPNVHGGRENLEAIAFLRQLNDTVYRLYPDVQTIAEDSTAWPMVSRPTAMGGLGFGLKWDMGWMHDTLRYLQRDPVHRCHHQHDLTFRSLYVAHENYVLPLSHDEVVHGKRALVSKMPGDPWQQVANLRLLFGYMFAQAGKKLIFMGSELAQWDEWNWQKSLDWHLLQWERHGGVCKLLGDLNRLYRSERALHEFDCAPEGFDWLACDDAAQSVYVVERRGGTGARPLVIVVNATPVCHANYRIGVPRGGRWQVVLNTDAACYGGSNAGDPGVLEAAPIAYCGRFHSVMVTLPPLAVVFFAPVG